MARFHICSIVVAQFLALICSAEIFRREDTPDAQLFPQIQSGQYAFAPSSLDGRSLIASWLGIRQETCVDSGYYLCADGSGCCPSGEGCCPNGCCPGGDNCCTNINACVEPGGECCSTGVCPSGWSCCTAGHCYPNGGQCCSTGYYCTPGNVCVLVDGAQKCCTDDQCTAYVVGTVTVGGGAQPINTGTALPSPTTTEPTGTLITQAPTTATQQTLYQYYYFTYTWVYYSYYWIYITVDLTEQSTTTYTQETYTTIVSFYETNSNAASSSFAHFSATLSPTTPAAATNPINTLPPPTATATASGGGTGSGIGGTTAPSSKTTTKATTTAQSSSSTSSGPATVTGSGGATQLRSSFGGSWTMPAFAALFLSSGFFMVWL